MKQYLIEFKHDSRHLGYDSFGQLLVSANSFEEACKKVPSFKAKLVNSATGYSWYEGFTNPRDFINLTLD